jgi:hypothetical protein
MKLFKSLSNQDPIVIVVEDGQWNAYGPETARSIFLVKLVQQQGGINESVEDGRYHFNAIRRGLKLELSLNRIN